MSDNLKLKHLRPVTPHLSRGLGGLGQYGGVLPKIPQQVRDDRGVLRDDICEVQDYLGACGIIKQVNPDD